MDANQFNLKKLNNGVEPMFDLVTGHVEVEIVKSGVEPPIVKAETMELCRNGEEVTADNEVYRKLLANYTRDHGTHLVDLQDTRRTLDFTYENPKLTKNMNRKNMKVIPTRTQPTS